MPYKDPVQGRRANRRAYYKKTRSLGFCGPDFFAYKGLCVGCQKEKPLCRDHDHINGLPRGRLCRACNLAVGNANDCPETLQRLAEYIKERSHHPSEKLNGMDVLFPEKVPGEYVCSL